MCPLCWTTMLAAFSIYFGASAAVLAWKDWLVVLLALTFVAAAAVHTLAIAAIPWPAFAALAMRVAWLLARRRDRILLVTAVRRAKTTAAARCPNRPGAI